MSTRTKRGKLAVLMTQVLTLYTTKYVVEQLGITQTTISSISRGATMNPPKRPDDIKRAKKITRKLEELRSAAKNGVPTEHRRRRAFAFQKRKKTKVKDKGKKTSALGNERKAMAKIFKGLHAELLTHLRPVDVAKRLGMPQYAMYNITHSSGARTALVVWRERIGLIKSILAGYDDTQQLDKERDRIIDEHASERQVHEPVAPQPAEHQRNGKFSMLATIIETSTGIETKMPLGSTLRFNASEIEISTDEQGVCVITIGE